MTTPTKIPKAKLADVQADARERAFVSHATWFARPARMYAENCWMTAVRTGVPGYQQYSAHAYGRTEGEANARAAMFIAAPGLQADNERLRSEIVRLGRIFQRVAPQIGWRGVGPDANIYYCEFCRESHRDSDKIVHKKNCPILNIRASLNADAE